MNILVIHGPNLNLLGERNKGIYGEKTLSQINALMKKEAKNHKIKFFFSNHEGAIIDVIQKNRRWADRIIINPGALTHYSYALRDAIEAVGIKTIETHLSDISKRESFRKKSVIKPVCQKQIKGFGYLSYIKALKYCLKND